MLLSFRQSNAQDFALTLTNTPGPVAIGSNLVYSLSVSNARGFNLNPGLITSQFPASADVISGTNSNGGVTNLGGGTVTFGINNFSNNAVIQIELILQATEAGLFTNRFTVTEPQSISATTNAVTQIVAGFADLGISIELSSPDAFVGDTITYGLIATNAGPDTVSGVIVSNSFPANVTLVQLTPAGLAVLTNGFVIFSPDNDHVEAFVSIRVDATNTIPLSATISAPDIVDDNPTNNTFTTNVTVLVPVLGQIITTNLSPQQFNPQTGYVEQHVDLINISTSAVESVRLLVAGLTNRLANAVATNGSTPFVVHAAPLGASEKVNLLLEYFNPSRAPGANPSLTAYGVPAVNLTPATGTGIHVDRLIPPTFFTNINTGRVLLEFSAVPGRQYQVIYSGTNGLGDDIASLQKVEAHGNRVQWLDYGPPRTLSAPTNAVSRFYQVIELP